MEKWLNAGVTIGMLSCFAAFVFWFWNRQAVTEKKERAVSYEGICAEVKQRINQYIGINVAGMGLSRQMMHNQEEQRQIVAAGIRSCCGGDVGAREAVKELIRSYLSKERGINVKTIGYLVPFQNAEAMTERQLAETMIYVLDKEGDSGFLRLQEKFGLCNVKQDARGNEVYEITKEEIRAIWELMQPELSYTDKLNIVTQMIYADTYGLGAVDILNWQQGLIEEIQIGLTGISGKAYNYKEELLKTENKLQKNYSKDSIHIMVSGNTIRLSYLSFGTEEEMQRVLRNLIKDSEAGELTVNKPQAVIEAPDGRRISIARPPMTDSWTGFIRKFDNRQKVTLKEWCEEMSQGEQIASILTGLVRCGAHLAFTGEMAAGKTTLFRACLAETRPDYNIRIIESESLELNPRQFLEERNTLAMRVTETMQEEEILAFARKTTGQIFGIGEVNSLTMANLTMNLVKIAQQVMFSAHYVTTEDMVIDFTNAKLCVGNYTNVTLAEMDAVRSLGFDIHIRKLHGKRYVQYINEIIPELSQNELKNNTYQKESDTERLAVEAIQGIRQQLGKQRTYQIRTLLYYCEEKNAYVFLEKPSLRCFEKASWYMPQVQYEEFVRLWEKIFEFQEV